MDRLKGFGSSLVGAAGNMVDKSGISDKLSSLNYLNKVYELGYRKFSVKKLIAEGGFGFVFLVRDVSNERQYALKRMIVQDRDRVGAVKSEVGIMKSLARQPHVVCLEDSKISDNRGEMEVLLLMEYCTCSLMDALNQGRVRSEQEIYDIFGQICIAVAQLHSMNPPISHRDLKVENVLLGEDGRWKLCDFGSATTSTYLPSNERERSIAEDDINRNTTMMYRAPEMVDLWRKQPINEKVDVWALGCILFKMAYKVDAFDGGLGIMNARYTFPEFRKSTPAFEDFIKYLLTPDPTERPNIQQVQERLASLRGVPYQGAPRSSSSSSASSSSSSSSSSSYSSPSSSSPGPSRAALGSSGNVYSNGNNSSRPSAPNAKAANNLVDWNDSPSHPPSSSSSSSYSGHNNNNSNPVSPPRTQSKNNLLDALEWQGSSAPAKSSPSSHSPSPSSPSVTRANTRPTPPPSSQQQQQQQQQQRSSAADLLDFSDAPPLPAKSNPVFSPPVPQPTFYSPQLPHHNAHYHPSAHVPQNYFSPTMARAQPHPQPQPQPQLQFQPNRTVPGAYDPLAQFTQQKPTTTPSSGEFDFDPLAPAKKSSTPLPPPIQPQQQQNFPPPPAKALSPPPRW